MEDFPVLLLILIIYLIAGASRRKKPKKKKSPLRTAAQGEQRDARAAMRDRQTRAGFDQAFSGQAKPATTRHKGCDPLHIHLHEATQQQLAHASEGEDPCHAGGEVPTGETVYAPQQEEAQEMFAANVLHGVIMSEILTRPHERAAMRRGRR